MAGPVALTGPECRPEDVSVTVEWELTDDGALAGAVVVANTGAAACRLSGKPFVGPLGTDGRRLDTTTIVSLEFRRPGHAVVAPGQRARSRISWSGWAGPPAGDRALVGWGPVEGRTEVTAPVRGPVQPARTGEPHNLTSSWFQVDEQRTGSGEPRS